MTAQISLKQPTAMPLYSNGQTCSKKLKKETTDKERSFLGNFVIDPIKTVSAGASLFYNIPKTKGGLCLPLCVFIASGVTTLADKGLKYSDGYKQIASLVSKKPNRQDKIATKLEKCMKRLSLGLQLASLYFIFRKRPQKKTSPNIHAVPLSLPESVISYNQVHTQTTTVLYNPTMAICNKQKNITVPTLTATLPTTITHYQVTKDKVALFLHSFTEIVNPSNLLGTIKNSCLEVLDTQIHKIKNIKQKLSNEILRLFEIFKNYCENYFVKI